jgi:acetoin utilization protein AcuB
MFVRDRMSSPAVTITPDISLQDALKLMHERQFRRLPVVDDRDELIGIVSERDLLYASPPPAALLGGQGLDDLLSGLLVEEIMTEEVIAATPDAFIEEAARLMADNKIGGLPVVDEDNHVVGVITETDVFRAFIDIYGAGHSGLYLMLEVPDRKGVVVELSRAIFDWGGNIVSVSSFYDDPRGDHKLIIKGHDINKDQVVDVLESLGYHVIDVHEL